MPQRAPVKEIQHSSVEEAKTLNVNWWDTITSIPTDTTVTTDSSTTLQTGNLRAYAIYGS